MSKCQSCPIAGECIAERPGYGFACKFATGAESEKIWLANQSAKVQGKPPPEYPSFLAQIGNAAKAAVAFVASGCETVDDDEYNRRRSICSTCEFQDAASDRCRQCGCRLSMKTRGSAFTCPVGKW